jgi:hypothetical protein
VRYSESGFVVASDSITFEIKPEHILRGEKADCSKCMVALAIKDAIDYEADVRVIDNEEIKIDGVPKSGRKVLNQLIDNFDRLGQAFTFAENYKPVYTLTKYEQDETII